MHNGQKARVCFDVMRSCNNHQQSQDVQSFASWPLLLQQWILVNTTKTKGSLHCCKNLGCENLQSREDHNKVEMMYRIVDNLIEIPTSQYLAAKGVALKPALFFANILFYKCLKGTLLSICNLSLEKYGVPANANVAPTLDDFSLLVGAGILRSWP